MRTLEPSDTPNNLRWGPHTQSGFESSIPDGWDRVFSLLELQPPSGDYCVRGKRVYLGSIRDPRKQKFVRLPCENWGCSTCGPRKLTVAGLHFAERFLLTNGSLIARTCTTPAEWDALRQEWQRRKKKGYGPVSWVKVGCTGQPSKVIECHPDPFAEVLPGKVLSDRDQAIRVLGEALRQVKLVRVGTRFKPLAYSRDWAMPEREKRYRVLGCLRVTDPNALLSILDAKGIKAVIRNRSALGGWDIAFEVPDEMDTTDILTAACVTTKLLETPDIRAS